MKKQLLTLLMIFCSFGCYAKIPDMKNFPHEKVIMDDDQTVNMHKTEDLFIFYKTGNAEKIYFTAFDPVTKCTFYLDGLSICYIQDKSGEYHQNTDYYFQEREIFEGHFYTFKDNGKKHRLIVYFHKDHQTIEGALQTFE